MLEAEQRTIALALAMGEKAYVQPQKNQGRIMF